MNFNFFLQIAEELGLGHDSVGEGEQRVMVLTKPDNYSGNSLTDFVIFRGYLALIGPSIEYAASLFLERVPAQGKCWKRTNGFC